MDTTGKDELGGNAKPYPKPIQPECSISLAEIVKVFREEMSYQQQRIYTLELKIGRYDRVFETMFKEELDSRVNGKDRNGYGQVREDPFWKLEKALAQQREMGGLGGSSSF
jgi:hypothetical protein